jgi:hypothetical protein
MVLIPTPTAPRAAWPAARGGRRRTSRSGTGARTDRTGTGLAAAGEHLNPPPRLATPRSSGRGQVAAAAGLASWGDGPVEQAGLPGDGGGGEGQG